MSSPILNFLIKQKKILKLKFLMRGKFSFKSYERGYNIYDVVNIYDGS